MTDDSELFKDADELEQFCWKASDRHCSSECVAYDPRCESDPRWTPCLLLNTDRAQARALNKLAEEAQKLTGFVKAENDLLKKGSAREYAEKLKEMDPPPPKART